MGNPFLNRRIRSLYRGGNIQEYTRRFAAPFMIFKFSKEISGGKRGEWRRNAQEKLGWSGRLKCEHGKEGQRRRHS